MENDEKRWNRMMAIIFFLAMMGILVFMIRKNENAEKENATSPSPTIEVTAEPMK